jgi:wyosine [tRNA(Phe)-imidazoG37] synthetase (radical SAM superfamily)
MPKSYHYLFGPVPSRRLGRSLGVDLIPFKTCTMDCIYCQLGETPCAVSQRSDYVPMQDVLTELERWKKADGQADHITLAGSGEPTLHSHFGDVFRWVKAHSDIQSVLLTNGTLLHLPEVREEAALADKVKVTLSAWDEASFRQIHRPAEGVTFDQLINGERAFREGYSGELSVEVFIIDGVNSHLSQVRKISEAVNAIHPDRVDINTVVRPPAVEGVAPVSEGHLKELAKLFGDNTSIAPAFRKQGFVSMEISEEALLALISRHPATCGQLASEYNIPEESMLKKLSELVEQGLLLTENRGSETYYFQRR